MGSGELNGLDIGKLIREKTPGSRIVYVTSHTERDDGHSEKRRRAFYFVEKDFQSGYDDSRVWKMPEKHAVFPGDFQMIPGKKKGIRLPIVALMKRSASPSAASHLLRR